MEIGTTLKKLRVGKNITREELVKGIMSTNHYFKIENNENIISLDKFIAIISRLNVTFNEFAYVTNDYKNNEKKSNK
ncbi:XRE family transcriptional regulator, partial [Listeria monocytogenes]|nr:XRE family transcriptional regulator [Listeria monocytogenes]